MEHAYCLQCDWRGDVANPTLPSLYEWTPYRWQIVDRLKKELSFCKCPKSGGEISRKAVWIQTRHTLGKQSIKVGYYPILQSPYPVELDKIGNTSQNRKSSEEKNKEIERLYGILPDSDYQINEHNRERFELSKENRYQKNRCIL